MEIIENRNGHCLNKLLEITRNQFLPYTKSRWKHKKENRNLLNISIHEKGKKIKYTKYHSRNIYISSKAMEL